MAFQSEWSILWGGMPTTSTPLVHSTCVEEVQRLLQQQVPVERITALSFYRAQNEEINKLAKETLPGLEVATVAAYQGKEQDYIILSL